VIPNLLPQLNNFSLSIDEIIKDYKETDKSPKELSFIDLSPLIPPPPPEDIDVDGESEENKDFENITDPIGSLTNLSKKIVKLQNSINEIFTNNDELIENQKQILQTLKNQNFFYDLKLGNNSQIENPYDTKISKEVFNTTFIKDNFTEKYIIKESNNDLNTNQTNLDFNKLSADLNLKTSTITKIGFEYTDIPQIKVDNISIPVNIEQIPNIDLPKLENLRIPIDYQYPNNVPPPITYGEIKTQTIPIKYDIPEISVDAKVRFDIENNLEIPKVDPIKIPVIMGDTPELKPIKLETILQMVEVKQFSDWKLPNIESVDVPINYDKVIKPSFDYSDIDTPKLNPIWDIDTTPIKDYYKTLNILNDSVLRNISIPIDVNIKDNLINNYKKPILEDNLINNYKKPILENNSSLLNYVKYNGDLITPNVKSITEKVNENLDTNYQPIISNEINLSGEDTLEKMSRYLNSLVETENQNIETKIDQLSLGINNIKTDFNDLITDISFDKLNSLGKYQSSTAMVSMIDKNQFSSLMDRLEKNSKIISDDLSKNTPKTDTQSNTSFVNFTTTQNQVNNKDKSEDILKVMSSLDDKMSLMIDALNSLSTIMIDSKPNNFSLRPNKHY